MSGKPRPDRTSVASVYVGLRITPAEAAKLQRLVDAENERAAKREARWRARLDPEEFERRRNSPTSEVHRQTKRVTLSALVRAVIRNLRKPPEVYL